MLSSAQAQAVILQIMGLATYQSQCKDLAWLGYEQGIKVGCWCIIISRQGQPSDYKILQQIFAGMHTQLVALGHEKAGAINNNKGLYIWDFGQISREKVSSIQQQDNFEYMNFFPQA